MKMNWKILAALLVLTNAPAAHARVYTSFYAGAWRSFFTQEGAGQGVKIGTNIHPGFQWNFGFGIGPIFFEYAPYYFMGHTSIGSDGSSAASDDVSQLSLLSANAGVEVPGIGLTGYIGTGRGDYDFQSGSEAEFYGTHLRFGATYPVFTEEGLSLRIKAEYQRLFITSDDAGAIPDGFTNRSNTFFLGFGLQFSSK